MPRAGWCRECGEWVWVDGQGACQNGHGAECVGGIYDAEEKLPGIERIEPDFGVGDLPADLNRFNWGAFLMPLLWSIGFGAWSVLALWALMSLVPFVLVVVVGSFGEDVLRDNALALGIVAEVIAGGIRLWIGANATRLLWQRERLRLEVLDGARPRFNVSRYASRQRSWARFGISWTVLTLAGLALLAWGTDPTIIEVRKQYPVTPLDAGLSAFWLLAEIGLGLWLAAMMRKEAAGELPLPPEA